MCYFHSRAVVTLSVPAGKQSVGSVADCKKVFFTRWYLRILFQIYLHDAIIVVSYMAVITLLARLKSVENRCCTHSDRRFTMYALRLL